MNAFPRAATFGPLQIYPSPLPEGLIEIKNRRECALNARVAHPVQMTLQQVSVSGSRARNSLAKFDTGAVKEAKVP